MKLYELPIEKLTPGLKVRKGNFRGHIVRSFMDVDDIIVEIKWSWDLPDDTGLTYTIKLYDNIEVDSQYKITRLHCLAKK